MSLPEVGESEGPARRFFVRVWGRFRLRHAGSPLDRVRASTPPRQHRIGVVILIIARPHVDEARAVIELAKWNASTHKIVSALPPARPVSVKSACLEADATTSTRMGCTLLD